MSTIKVDVSSSKKPVLQVGYQEENEVTDVLFDISAWVEEYGGGTAGLRVKRPQNSEEESYELSLPISENIATWTISRTDTFNKGNGKVQLKYYVGSALKESAVYTYKVGKSIVGSDDPVDPFDTWIERSKAWATGELLDGEDVPASDETYHNNAKYYAEQSGTQAEEAETQAVEAKAQADTAKQYAHQFVGAPRAAAAAADMTDHDLIYVFTGTTTSSLTNGHWYYWNGSAWTDGGVYNSTAFTTDTTLSVSGAAADAKVVGDLKEELNSQRTISTWVDGKFVFYNSGGEFNGELFSCSDFIDLSKAPKILVKTKIYGNAGICFYDDDKTYVSGINDSTTNQYSPAKEYELSVPSTARYVRISTIDKTVTNYKLLSATEYIQILDAELNVETELSISDWTSGKFIYYASGGELSSAGYNASDFINIFGNREIVVKTKIYGNAGICFYDKDKSYVSGINDSTTNQNSPAKEYELSVPSGAYFVRISTLNTTVTWVKSESLAQNTKTIAEITLKTAELADNLSEQKNISLSNYATTNIYISSNNTWNAGGDNTNYLIPLDGATEVIITGGTGATYATLLQKKGTVTIGGTPAFADSAKLRTIPAGEVATIKVPASAKLLHIRTATADAPTTPSSIVFSVPRNRSSNKQPMVCFVDDDARQTALDWLEQVVDATRIPITIALITGFVGETNYSTWANLRRLRGKGFVFVPHTNGADVLDDLTQEEMEYSFSECQRLMEEHGMLDTDILVYPTGSANATTLGIVKNWFRFGASTRPGINVAPIDTFYLLRNTIDGATTLESCKALVDKTKALNGLCIFYGHAYGSEYDSSKLADYVALVQYIGEQGVEILSLPEALDKYRNYVDGNVKVGCDGVTY